MTIGEIIAACIHTGPQLTHCEIITVLYSEEGEALTWSHLFDCVVIDDFMVVFIETTV